MSNDKTTLLIVDDDVDIRELLEQFLGQYDFDVLTAHEGEQMYQQLANHHVDLIILDMMLPGDDGFALCRQLRYGDTYSHIPILMLSAVGDETDRIVGLEVGADDYLAKPFSPRELLARTKAILRRSHSHSENHDKSPSTVPKRLQFSQWLLNLSTQQLISPNRIEISLSSGEYALLLAFLNHPQQILSRERLVELTHEGDSGSLDRGIDMQVSRLRQKIEENPKKPKFIKTVRGGGYLFTCDVTPIYD